MDVNPKTHASKKRCKKFASQRDYKYGGKIGGHSVKRAKWYWTRYGDEPVQVTSYSEQDNLLKNAGLKLPVEEALGFELHKANRTNFSKMEKVKAALESSGATTKVSNLELDRDSQSHASRTTLKKTWYALPTSEEDVHGIVAHAQQKKRRQARKMLAEFGLKQERGGTDRRVRLTRFLPHGEIFYKKVPCITGREPGTGVFKKMGLVDINFRTPMKVVGIGFRALKVKHIHWTPDNREYVTVGPLRAKVQFQQFNSNAKQGEWVGTQAKADGVHSRVQYSGPRDGSSEIAHSLNISNCKALKVEAMDLVAFDGSLRHVNCSPYDPNFDSKKLRGHYCFEVFVYGSPEPSAEAEEEKVPVGSGAIKNAEEVQNQVTVVCLAEAETVVPKWSLYTYDYKYSYHYNDKPTKIRTDKDFVIRGQEGY